MNASQRIVVEEAQCLAAELPQASVEAVAAVLATATVDSWKAARAEILEAVADGTWAFLSSANLTEYAFTVNMELGVLFRGGHVPRQIEAHFDRLVAAGVLVRV